MDDTGNVIPSRDKFAGHLIEIVGIMDARRVVARVNQMTGQKSFDAARDERTNTGGKLRDWLCKQDTDALLPAYARVVPDLYQREWRTFFNEPNFVLALAANTPETVSTTTVAQDNTHATPSPSTDAMADLMRAVQRFAAPAAASISMEAVQAAIEKRVAAAETTLGDMIAEVAGQARPTVVAVANVETGNTTSIGIQHAQFPMLLKACQARTASGHRLNIWVHGPAGTGKTTAAENVAKALELPFYFNGCLETKYDVLGFVDANGKLTTTQFLQAWENGGVYLFDEIDGSQPGVLIAINGALANGVCPFPDGRMVPRHKDFVCIAGANTTGLGGTIEYVGRMKQDAALVDRFVFVAWPIDEALELAISGNATWCKRVQQVRQKVKDRGLKGVLVTPRATINGAALLTAGLPLEFVIEATLQKAMTTEQWQQVK